MPCPFQADHWFLHCVYWVISQIINLRTHSSQSIQPNYEQLRAEIHFKTFSQRIQYSFVLCRNCILRSLIWPSSKLSSRCLNTSKSANSNFHQVMPYTHSLLQWKQFCLQSLTRSKTAPNACNIAVQTTVSSSLSSCRYFFGHHKSLFQFPCCMLRGKGIK